ncbi:hypothetical protein SUGI_1139890 [Cryptomeria japonica]|nr:hypothetical protein SUGI_1139890 [Cryptomeria japonica]
MPSLWVQPHMDCIESDSSPTPSYLGSVADYNSSLNHNNTLQDENCGWEEVDSKCLKSHENVFLEDKDLYNKTFGDDVKRDQFLRWWDQFLTKGICLLSFNLGNVVEQLEDKWNKLWNELLK